MTLVFVFKLVSCVQNGRRGAEVEHSPRMREIGIRSPVATDLNR